MSRHQETENIFQDPKGIVRPTNKLERLSMIRRTRLLGLQIAREQRSYGRFLAFSKIKI